MSNLVVLLDVLIVGGLVVSAILACHFEKLLSSVIALGITGIFAAAAFLLLHAPDVAISEAAVGAALTPAVFIVALRVTCHAQGKEGGGRFARIVHRLCGIQFSKEALFLQVEHVLPFVCLGQGMVQLVTALPVLATGCVVSCHEHHGQRAVLILFIPELHGCVIQTLHDGGGIAVGRHPLFLSPAATCHEDEQREQ